MGNGIQTLLTKTLEDIKLRDEDGKEYWSARDLVEVLGYDEWRNFFKVIEKAKISCHQSGNLVSNHFVDINKMVRLGSGGEREIHDILLTRFACYLIAQNGDSSKPQIAFSQMYFAVQTRKQELRGEHVKELERLKARKKLSETEKKFANVVWDRGVDGQGISEIRSAGDTQLFGGYNTKQMKHKLNIQSNKPLADHLATVLIKAKDLATEITTINTEKNNLQGKEPIKGEHMTNNQEARILLTSRGITPENLPAEEDTKKHERKYGEELKKEIASEQDNNQNILE